MMEELKKEMDGQEINPDDLMAMWEEALKEASPSKEAEKAPPDSPKTVVSPPSPKEKPASQPATFQEISPSKGVEGAHDLDFILDIPLEISVEIGRTKMLIKDLLKLTQGSIIELEKTTGEPIEIFVNGKLMAKGEVVVVNDRFGIRITEIISAQDRIKKLGS